MNTPTPPDACLLYVTTGNLEEAQHIARELLQEQRIACANVIPGMRSYYTWQGQMEEEQECILLLKTRMSLQAAVRARVAELHSYEVSAILTISLADGHVPFMDWIAEETEGAAGR